MNVFLALFICVLYLGLVIGTAELLQRRWHLSNQVTRKIIHIGAGMTIWLAAWLFTSPWPFVIACGLLLLFTLLDWRFGWLPAMTSNDATNLGTVYFPMATAAAVLVFWGKPGLMVASLMPLTWGDGLAPIVGRLYGRHRYTIWGHTRSWQGSGAFLVSAFIFTLLALVVFGVFQAAPLASIALALLLGLATALAESVTVRGLDNLSVTAVAILILLTWPFYG